MAPQDSERAAREFFGGPGPDQGAEPKRMDDGAIVMGEDGAQIWKFPARHGGTPRSLAGFRENPIVRNG